LYTKPRFFLQFHERKIKCLTCSVVDWTITHRNKNSEIYTNLVPPTSQHMHAHTHIHKNTTHTHIKQTQQHLHIEKQTHLGKTEETETETRRQTNK
jgi:hypothetical protein